MIDLKPIAWEPVGIPGLLVIERTDPEVWQEWYRLTRPRAIPPVRVPNPERKES